MLFKILIVCLLAFFGQHIWKLLGVLKPFQVIFNHRPGPCQLIPGAGRGSEDFNLLSNGLVLISSGLTSFGYIEDTKSQYGGRLLLFNFSKTDEIEELQLLNFESVTFNPHGISVWEDDNSESVTVYVVNHRTQDECVEVFSLDKQSHQLTHIRTVRDELFIHINDVVAAGHDSFYANVEFATNHWFTRMMEVYLLLSVGKLVYYDGHMVRTVASGVSAPNGVALSNDKRVLYASIPKNKAINAFRRDMSTNDLTLEQVFDVGVSADNVHVDADGNLWAATFPRAIDTIKHLSNASHPSPSQVLRLQTSKSGFIESIIDVFVDNGTLISGASSALYYKRKLLIGSIQHNLVLCDVLTPFI